LFHQVIQVILQCIGIGAEMIGYEIITWNMRCYTREEFKFLDLGSSGLSNLPNYIE